MRFRLALLFAGLFAAGVAAGAAFEKALIHHLMPAIRFGLGVGEKMASGGASDFLMFLLVFAKNLSVAALCICLAKPTRGIVPAWVCLANGLVVGTLGALLAARGVPPWQYAVLLAPHGVVELPALFLACALGLTLGGGVLVRLRRGIPIVAGMFAAAAALEVWVSPLVGRLLGC
ncbi:stage II sporulation protein M [Desulfovirgula thermocuniculi]|uniref:stage II sporulation protein M n=1 Tax=Desulfovirgula thermocuniculi TaxID=348842 RepID=UPI000424C172|nr:stage II sporulation protein M [Desulfovirgula thermocuniculi]